MTGGARGWWRRAGGTEWLVILLLLLGSMTLHALFSIHWDRLELSSTPGDDDEGYFLLAYQVLGLIPEPPVFLFRGPGWPLILAGLLRVAGPENAWIVLVFHRLVVAVVPVLIYVALRPLLARGLALVPAALSIFLYAAFWSIPRAYTEVSYLASGLLAVTAAMRAASGRPRMSWVWLSVASAALVVHSAVRQTGIALAVALALVLGLATRPVRRWLLTAAVLAVPTICLIVGLSWYHRSVVGAFRFAGTGAGYLVNVFTLADGVEVPDTPQVSRVHAVLPEVPRAYLFATPTDYWLAVFRLSRQLPGPTQAHDLLNAVGYQVARANARRYARWQLRLLTLQLLDPYRSIAPSTWYARRPGAEVRDFHPPLPACSGAFLLSLQRDALACRISETLRAQTRWQVVGLPPIFDQVRWARWQDAIHLGVEAWSQRAGGDARAATTLAVVTRLTVPYLSQLKRVANASVWSVLTLAALVVLIRNRSARIAGLILGAAVAAETLPYVILGDPWQPRWYTYPHVFRFVANWLAAGMLVQAWRVRGTKSTDLVPAKTPMRVRADER